MATLQEITDLERRAFTNSENPVFESTEARFNRWQLTNENIPQWMIAAFWPFLDKETALTNLEREDVNKLQVDVRIAILNAKMAHPDFETTYDEITNLDLIRPKIFLRSMRSTGGLARERAIEATQIRQILTGEGSAAPQGGIISSLGALNPFGKKR